MKIQFTKALLAGSVFMMGAFGLTACGDDSSSGSNPDTPAIIDVPDKQDASIVFSELRAAPAGTMVKLTGSITLDFTDTLSSATPENLQFTDLKIQIGKLNGTNLVTTAAEPTIQSMPTFPRVGVLSLTEMGVLFDLQNEALTECGDYQFIVTAYATDGTNNFENNQKVTFNRSDMYCAVTPDPDQQPTTEEVAMEACPEITLSTNMTPGLDLASCSATTDPTADIVIVKTASSDFNITSGNGTLFAPISNSEDYFVGNGGWPEDVKGSVSMSDFQYKVITGTAINNFVENDDLSIYVAKTAAFNEATGAGFFAFGVTNKVEGNNGDFTVTFKVYRAK